MVDGQYAGEEEYLASVMAEVSAQLGAAEASSNLDERSVIETRRELWQEISSRVAAPDNGDEESRIRQELSRAQAFAQASEGTATRLRRALTSPYFGRVDFTEQVPTPQAEASKVYVGPVGLRAPRSLEPLVYDWRSPIACLFYDAEVGAAEYTCSIGAVQGTVTLRRQFDISHGEIRGVFDSDLKVDDEVLRGVLAAGGSGRMRPIVATIQRDQNRAIRNETHRVVVVRGPAGSGKTSVALHRVAYLLYHHRDTLGGGRVLVLSPNRVFSDYVSHVLPDLGETDVAQSTFADFLTSLLPPNTLELESLQGFLDRLGATHAASRHHSRIAEPGPSSDPEIVDAKGSLAMVSALEAFSAGYAAERLPPCDVSFAGTLVLEAREVVSALADAHGLPLALGLRQLLVRAQERLKRSERARRKELFEEVKDGAETYLLQSEITAAVRERLESELAPVRAALSSQLTIDAVAVYGSFLASSQAANVGISESHTGATLKLISQGVLPYEDQAAVAYLYGLVQGFPHIRDVRHVVVDEVQDYSPVHMALLQRLLPGRSFTLVGDDEQRLSPGAPWLCALPSVFSSPTSPFSDYIDVAFTRSYRSTTPIHDFCWRLSAAGRSASAPAPHSLERPGPAPRMVLTPERAGPLALTLALECRKSMREGPSPLAVICSTTAEASRTHAALIALRLNAALVTDRADELPQGLLVVPVGIAKGLEFSSVIALPSLASNPRALYTACSRGTHRLSVLAVGNATNKLPGGERSCRTRGPAVANVSGIHCQTGGVPSGNRSADGAPFRCRKAQRRLRGRCARGV